MSESNLKLELTDPYYQNPFVKLSLKIIENPYTEAFFLASVICNTFFLALDSYPLPEETLEHTLHITNQVFTLIFVVEVSIKSVAMGLKNYLKDSYN